MTLKTPLKFPFKAVLFAALVGILTFATVCFALSGKPAYAAEIENAMAVVPFETMGIGNESGCAKRALFAINDAAEWQRVWAVHTQGIADAQQMPKIDFSRQTVIAVLSGERNDGKSIQIAQVVRGPQETVVYFMLSDEKSWLGVAEGQANAGQPKSVRPYVFVAIDKITSFPRFADVYGTQNSCSKCAG